MALYIRQDWQELLVLPDFFYDLPGANLFFAINSSTSNSFSINDNKQLTTFCLLDY